jgi:hypothetical protein
MTIWHACTDCYLAHHYGAIDFEGQWFAGESDIPADRQPLALVPRFHYVADAMDDDHEPFFTWAPCDTCGSTLGGDRFDLAVHDPR